MKTVVTIFLSLCIFTALVAGTFAAGQGEKAEKVTIEHFDQKGGNLEALNALVTKFMEKNPNIIIKLSTPPDAETVAGSRIASGDYPDILSHWGGEDYAKAGLLLDLTKEAFVQNSLPGFVESTRINGKLYCVTLAANLFGFIYNTTMFKDHGFAIPNTWNELINLLKTIKQSGITPVALADGAAWTLGHQSNCFYANLIPDFKNTMVKIHKGELNVQDVPAFKDVGTRLLELRNYGQPDYLGADHVQSVVDFTAGKAAMILNGNWMMEEIKGAATKEFSYSMFPVPFSGPDKTLMPSTIDWALSIFKTTKHPKEALAYLRYVASKEGNVLYCKLSNSPSALKNVTIDIAEFGLAGKYLGKGQLADQVTSIPELKPYWGGSMWTDNFIAAQNLIATRNVDAWMKDINKLFQGGWKK